MAVRILIKRRFKEKHFKEIVKMIREHRYGAMGQDGYLSSETMWDIKDPYRVVVASTWETLKQWNVWKNSEERVAVNKQINEYLDGETEFEEYQLGMYPH
jgi:heme-degrading monooxygenase HmoA